MRFVLFDPELCDFHKIVGHDGDAEEQLEALFSVGQATLHAPAADEYRDSAFDAGAEALCFF